MSKMNKLNHTSSESSLVSKNNDYAKEKQNSGEYRIKKLYFFLLCILPMINRFIFSESENGVTISKEKFKSQKKRIKKIKQKLISK